MLARNNSTNIVDFMNIIQLNVKSQLQNIRQLDRQVQRKILYYHNLNSHILQYRQNNKFNEENNEYSQLMNQQRTVSDSIKDLIKQKRKLARCLYNKLADACQQFDQFLSNDLNYKQDNQIGTFLKQCLGNHQITELIHRQQTKELQSLCICKGKQTDGQMIKCEFQACAARWYHLKCIGMKANKIPYSKWMCKKCNQSQ